MAAKLALCVALIHIPLALGGRVREIYLDNQCDKDIRFVLHYREKHGDWASRSYRFAGNTAKWLGAGSDPVKRLESDNGLIYFWAISNDGSVIWEGNNNYREGRCNDGDVRGMRKYTDTDGDIQLGLTCPNGFSLVPLEGGVVEGGIEGADTDSATTAQEDEIEANEVASYSDSEEDPLAW
eukprot:GHVN01006652.1.p1 GENE.GHVN01006652.1~~GHVN01006652.1.p1  ORF type:complete len:181 (-),score=14.72 GHVN01006652.1:111-653(-)